MSLLLRSLILRDEYKVRNTGVPGLVESLLWNTRFMLWGFFVPSTWNLVAMTFERYVTHPMRDTGKNQTKSSREKV